MAALVRMDAAWLTFRGERRRFTFTYVQDRSLGIDEIEDWWFDDVPRGIAALIKPTDAERTAIERDLLNHARGT